jgi:hypothetical protein
MEYSAPWVLHMNRSLDTVWDCIVYTTDCNRYVRIIGSLYCQFGSVVGKRGLCWI